MLSARHRRTSHKSPTVAFHHRSRNLSSPHPPPSPSVSALWFLLLIIVPCWSLRHLTQSYPFLTTFLLRYLLVVNVSTCALYYHDKTQSRIGGRQRISERCLHSCELGGGWPAAFVSQRVFHHKTRKPRYQEVFWVIVFVHELVGADVIMDGAGHRWVLRFLSDGPFR